MRIDSIYRQPKRGYWDLKFKEVITLLKVMSIGFIILGVIGL